MFQLSQKLSPLAERVALVTGASRGIGRSSSILLAGLGADVAVLARSVTANDDLAGSLSETAAAVVALGRECLVVPCDVSRQEDLDRALASTVEHFGHVDVLVNNAAAMQPEMYDTFWAMTPGSWRYQMDVNVNAYWALTHAVALHLRSRRRAGLIVNVTSGAGFTRNPDVAVDGARVGAAYLASKAAVNQFTASVAGELSPFGITLIGVHPSHTRTENGLRLGALGGFRMDRGHDVDLPMRVFEHLLRREDLAALAGQIVFVPDYADAHGLRTLQGQAAGEET